MKFVIFDGKLRFALLSYFLRTNFFLNSSDQLIGHFAKKLPVRIIFWKSHFRFKISAFIKRFRRSENGDLPFVKIVFRFQWYPETLDWLFCQFVEFGREHLRRRRCCHRLWKERRSDSDIRNMSAKKQSDFLFRRSKSRQVTGQFFLSDRFEKEMQNRDFKQETLSETGHETGLQAAQGLACPV